MFQVQPTLVTEQSKRKRVQEKSRVLHGCYFTLGWSFREFVAKEAHVLWRFQGTGRHTTIPIFEHLKMEIVTKKKQAPQLRMERSLRRMS